MSAVSAIQIISRERQRFDKSESRLQRSDNAALNPWGFAQAGIKCAPLTLNKPPALDLCPSVEICG